MSNRIKQKLSKLLLILKKKPKIQPNTCRALVIYRPPVLFHLIVVGPLGTVLDLQYIPPTLLVQKFKIKCIEYFSAKDELQYFATSMRSLTNRYHLLKTSDGRSMRPTLTLETAGVRNDEMFHLIAKPKRESRKRHRVDAPRQYQIDLATKNMPEVKHAQPIMNREHIKSINIKMSIKNLVLHAAKLSAHIIGSGPLAAGLIETLQKQMAFEKQVTGDIYQAFEDMGFKRSAVMKSLEVNQNDFTKALAWLIDHPVGSNLIESEVFDPENPIQPSESIEAKNQFTNTKAKHIKSLLEIVRIYNRKDMPAVDAGAMLSMIDMGFDLDSIQEALHVCRNNVGVACEWLCGDRASAVYEAETGFPPGSVIVKNLLENPSFQQGLENPNVFMAFLSILSDYEAIGKWFQDTDTSRNVIYMMNTFYEEKQIQSIFHVSYITET